MENNWYVAVNGKTQGPYTWAQMVEMTKTGQIIAETQIYHHQLGNWIEAHTFKKLDLTDLQKGQTPKKKKGCLKGCLSVIGISVIVLLIVGLFVIKPLSSKEMMALGREKVVAEEKIDENGGIVEVNDSSSLIDGLILEVPEDTYNDNNKFTISTRKIKSHEFNDSFKPILPLIHVENGGDMADKVMTLTIPIDIDDDSFAMAAYYTEDGILEPIPMISQTNNELIIGVTHFSDIVVTALEKALLEQYIGKPIHDTGYRPTIDNWSFPNNGSEIEPMGICSGMSMSSIYYYVYHTKKGEESLYTYLDNNHYVNTNEQWKDDSIGIRLASIVQKDSNWIGYDEWAYTYLHKNELLSDQIIMYHFAYAFLLTDGNPQGVSLWVRTTHNNFVKLKDGHVIVAYAMDETGIYVCDPNFPKRTDLKIPFDGENFGTYNTALNADETEQPYNSFSLLGTTSIYSNEDFAELFAEAKKGPYESTIGDTVFSSPTFQVFTIDNDDIITVSDVEIVELLPENSAKYKKELMDYLTANSLYAAIRSKPTDWESKPYILVSANTGNVSGCLEMYLGNNIKPFYHSTILDFTDYVYVPLTDGLNNLGIYFSKKLTHISDEESWDSYDLIDFMRCNIYYGEEDLTGTWKGDYQLQEYEKAMNYAEDIGIQIAKGITWGLSKMFGQDLSDSEIEEIAKSSIEVNENISKPNPITVELSKEQDNTYNAIITTETDYIYTFETKAKYDGTNLTFSITYEDGSIIYYTYTLYDNESLEGEFEIKFGAIKDFASGITNLDKQ